MAIFVTTLDNVLIFSKGFVKDENVEAVEYKDNKELSYMTKGALNTLKSLNEKMTIIPVTPRSLEEYKRITFHSIFDHAILNNGLIVLYKGLVEDGNWQAQIKEKFDKMNLSDVESLLYNCSPLLESNFELKDYYYYAKVKEHQEIMVLKLLKPFLHKDWNCFVQDRKLYITPKFASVDNALQFISQKHSLDLNASFGAGVNIEDKKFMDLIINKISFTYSELWESLSELEKFDYSVLRIGLEDSEKMLKMIKGLY